MGAIVARAEHEVMQLCKVQVDVAVGTSEICFSTITKNLSRIGAQSPDTLRGTLDSPGSTLIQWSSTYFIPINCSAPKLRLGSHIRILNRWRTLLYNTVRFTAQSYGLVEPAELAFSQLYLPFGSFKVHSAVHGLVHCQSTGREGKTKRAKESNRCR